MSYIEPVSNVNGASVDDGFPVINFVFKDSLSLPEMGVVQDPSAAAANQTNREEVDARSIFVGNVDYACTPEEVQQHFQSCGTVNRVTIRTNKFGQPKGYAYVEFLEPEAVEQALLLNESELHGRQLKVELIIGGLILAPFFEHLKPFDREA
ncbi:hypothetical protein ACS0TY_022942 [Phlomoides rotata]